jgi:predicted ATPase with chaperone activity
MKALVKGIGAPALAITSVATIARGFASALDYYSRARELKLEIYRMNKESEIILEKIEKALQMQIAQMENIQHNYQQYTQNNQTELQNCNMNISEYGTMLQKISREMTLPTSSANEILIFSQQFTLISELLEKEIAMRQMLSAKNFEAFAQLQQILNGNTMKALKGAY